VNRIVRIIPAPPQIDDTVHLDHDRRNRRRLVFTAESGRSMLLDMPGVVHLRDGDALVLDDGKVVRVEASPEALIEITALSMAELVRLSWHLGNRHLPTQLLGDRLRIREDHVIAAMVTGLGGRCERIVAPFDPEGGAYVGSDGGGHAHADGSADRLGAAAHHAAHHHDASHHHG
jgi:urease accessory protein